VLKRTIWVVSLVAALLLGVGASSYAVWYYEPDKGSAEQEAKDKSHLEAITILASDRVAYYTKVLAIFTGALSAFGVAQIVFLIRADDTARVSANAALKAANVAERNLLAAHRPLITISPLALIDPTDPKYPSFIRLGFRNSGNGTAVINDVTVTVQTEAARGLTLKGGTTLTANQVDSAVEAGETLEPVEIGSTLFDRASVDQIRKGELILVVSFVINSQDIFLNRYSQTFSFRFDVERRALLRNPYFTEKKGS